jgi:hypothetical protein
MERHWGDGCPEVAAFAVLYRFHGKLTELYVVLGFRCDGCAAQPSCVS